MAGKPPPSLVPPDPTDRDGQGLPHSVTAWVEGRVELAAPTLWQYEVGNFLSRELPQEAAGKMAHLLDLRISSVALNESMCRQCFKWMRENRVTFYDASYLAVARNIQAVLVTADERFTRKMGETHQVYLLKDLDT